MFDLPGGPVLAWVHVLSFTDRDASAAHFVAKAELGPAPEGGRQGARRTAADEPGPLLDWYERVKRPLPWRATRDPYALLVSEVMLQQTQAARVVPYYEAFLRRFPDPSALAAAPTGTCSPTGAGSATTAARSSSSAPPAHVAAHGWPEDLTTLPGVGPYTAAAVASFAWDAQVAAVDTNVRRVLERHDGAAASRPRRAGGRRS